MSTLRAMAFALLFFYMAGAAFAQAQKWQDTAGMGIGDYFSKAQVPPDRQWYFLAMAAVGICLAINALVYVAGYVFHLPRWQMFAKAEFFQVTISALLIVNLVELSNAGFDYIMSMILPTGTTSACLGQQQDVYTFTDYGPIGLVKCKFQEKINYLYASYNALYAANYEVEVITSRCITVMNVQVWCGDWFEQFHDTMEKAHTLAHTIMPMLVALVAQWMFLDYIAKSAFAVLLPLGILLRILPPFRGIGGLLIAIGIGFYVVFPVIYIMLDPTSIIADQKTLKMPDPPPKKCYSGFSGLISSMGDMSAIEDPMAPGSRPSTPGPSMDQLGSEMGKLRVDIVFLPLVALAGTVIFIQYAAPFLGGDSGELVHFVSKVI